MQVWETRSRSVTSLLCGPGYVLRPGPFLVCDGGPTPWVAEAPSLHGTRAGGVAALACPQVPLPVSQVGQLPPWPPRAPRCVPHGHEQAALWGSFFVLKCVPVLLLPF